MSKDQWNMFNILCLLGMKKQNKYFIKTKKKLILKNDIYLKNNYILKLFIEKYNITAFKI